MTLQASSNGHVLRQRVQFVIGSRFRRGWARHRQRLQTQLLEPFLTAQLRPEDVLLADMGQESVDEANRFEVRCGKEGEYMKDHCARQYTRHSARTRAAQPYVQWGAGTQSLPACDTGYCVSQSP